MSVLKRTVYKFNSGLISAFKQASYCEFFTWKNDWFKIDKRLLIGTIKRRIDLARTEMFLTLLRSHHWLCQDTSRTHTGKVDNWKLNHSIYETIMQQRYYSYVE